jgi:hypothetical protein
MSLKRYNGTEWVVVAGSRPGPTGATGATGPAGTAATISAGAVTTLAAGSNATVANTGTASAAVFSFGIPRGATGATGSAGVAGTRGSKTYTAQSIPQNAGLTNLIEADNFINLSNGDYYTYSSSTSTWVLQGNVRGPQGIQGEAGPTGATGPAGPIGDVVVANIEKRVSAYEVDTLLNLGIYYPKYALTSSLAQINGTIMATSFIF